MGIRSRIRRTIPWYDRGHGTRRPVGTVERRRKGCVRRAGIDSRRRRRSRSLRLGESKRVRLKFWCNACSAESMLAGHLYIPTGLPPKPLVGASSVMRLMVRWRGTYSARYWFNCLRRPISERCRNSAFKKSRSGKACAS